MGHVTFVTVPSLACRPDRVPVLLSALQREEWCIKNGACVHQDPRLDTPRCDKVILRPRAPKDNQEVEVMGRQWRVTQVGRGEKAASGDSYISVPVFWGWSALGHMFHSHDTRSARIAGSREAQGVQRHLAN